MSDTTASIFVNGQPIDYATVPAPHMADGVERYIEHGIPGGSFLMALVSNDLFGAAARADDMNRRLLFEWVRWFHNRAPRGYYGSPENADEWMKHRRAAQTERSPS